MPHPVYAQLSTTLLTARQVALFSVSHGLQPLLYHSITMHTETSPDRAWRSGAPAAGCSFDLCHAIIRRPKSAKEREIERTQAAYTNVGPTILCMMLPGCMYTCPVAILLSDRCTAIQVSFCFERREKGVLGGQEGKLDVRGGNNGESAILFIDTCVLDPFLRASGRGSRSTLSSWNTFSMNCLVS